MINTYKDYLDGGGTPLYPTKYTGRADGQFKVRCACGSLSYAQTMVDIRGVDNHLTQGQEFVCDGCISKWEREKRPIKVGDTFLVRHEFRAALIETLHGGKNADAEAVALKSLERSLALAEKEKARFEATNNLEMIAAATTKRDVLRARVDARKGI